LRSLSAVSSWGRFDLKEIEMKRGLAMTMGAGIALWSVVLVSGCDSRGQNEREFLNSAPPGVAPADPNESYAAKRGRLQDEAKKSRAEFDKTKRGSRRGR
jgi:hypothetical protein